MSLRKAALKVQAPVTDISGVLNRNTAVSLKEICTSCGISSAGNKSDLIQKIINSFAEHQSYSPNFIPKQIVSLDLGYRNFAQAVLQPSSSDPEKIDIVSWRKDSIDLPESFHPRTYAKLLNEHASRILNDPIIHPEALFLVERQTHRGNMNRQIPGIILNLNRIEIQIHCFLLQRHVAAIDARMVQTYYGWGTGSSKKRDSISLAKAYLEGKHERSSELGIPAQLKEYFYAQDKFDDLSDCLFQGFAYYQWCRRLAALHNQLLSQIRQ